MPNSPKTDTYVANEYKYGTNEYKYAKIGFVSISAKVVLDTLLSKL